ncbi:MAG: hypothetical protein C0402_04710 [Thermodesulfovibrio sp.]|nr:hypothetical protein [Thermodesulfovibrio sp.]
MMKRTLLIIAGLIVTVILFINVSGNKFEEKVQREVRQITEGTASAPAQKLTYNQLKILPEPVQRYFRHVLKDGQEYIRTVRLKQTGEFRAKESDQWVPLEAVQYYATKSPSFVWHARLKPTPYTWIESRDIYHKGIGFMEGKLLSAFPLVFDSGREMELSSLARFLSEAPWYPTALLPGKNLVWQAIDSHSAKAVINDAGYSVSAVFTFGDDGEITKVTSEDRHRNVNGKKERIGWTAYYKNYQELNGVQIPSEVEVEWNLPKGAFQYAKLKVTEIRYNEQ